MWLINNNNNKKTKNQRTIECDKSMITCDVVIAQCNNRTIKCEKKKKKGTTECDKNIVRRDVGTA